MVCSLSLCFFKVLTKLVGRRLLSLFVFPLIHKVDNEFSLPNECGLHWEIPELKQNFGHLQFYFKCVYHVSVMQIYYPDCVILSFDSSNKPSKSLKCWLGHFYLFIFTELHFVYINIIRLYKHYTSFQCL